MLREHTPKPLMLLSNSCLTLELSGEATGASGPMRPNKPRCCETRYDVDEPEGTLGTPAGTRSGSVPVLSSVPHPPVKAEPDGAPLEAAGSREVLVDNPRRVAQSFATPMFHRSRCASSDAGGRA